MTRFLVDTNVIVDVLSRDPAWFEWSASTLERCASEGPLAVNPIIFAELAVGFARIEDLDAALPQPDWLRLPLPWPAGFLAGRCFGEYRRRGCEEISPVAPRSPQAAGASGPRLQASGLRPRPERTGHPDGPRGARSEISSQPRRGGTRPSPLPDFYIGAHAAVEDLVVVTRDGARFQTYFPRVRLVQPGRPASSGGAAP